MIAESEAAFLLRAQSELLEASLNEVPTEAKKIQRMAITLSLRQTFVDLVTRLNVPLVLEIGANEGTFSKMVKNSRPGSRVVAFEAHPLVHTLYASEMKAAGVEYLQVCIAALEGDVTLKVPKTGDNREKLGKSSLLRKSKAASVAEYPMKAVTLDGFLGDASDLPNAMWIDVEGAVAHVLAGAERTLRNCQAVHVEMEPSAEWEGQIIDTDVMSRLAVYGLKPVLRDVQAYRLQYNAIFVR